MCFRSRYFRKGNIFTREVFQRNWGENNENLQNIFQFYQFAPTEVFLLYDPFLNNIYKKYIYNIIITNNTQTQKRNNVMIQKAN